MKSAASAPGKLIICGEHFVVYNEPAVVMAIDKRAYVTAEKIGERAIEISSANLRAACKFKGGASKVISGGPSSPEALTPIKIAAEATLKRLGGDTGLRLNVNSEIPVAAGLGSSAAVSVATVAAVGKLLGADPALNDISDLAYEAERHVHGRPSGIDQTISTFGGVISFKKDRGSTPLKVGVEVPMVVGDTGVPRSTGKLVSAVRAKLSRAPSAMKLIIQAGGLLSTVAADALKSGDLELLGEAMDINQGLLAAIGVSSEPLERMVYAARMSGALGAKLTGAGGGGCMIALTSRNCLGSVEKAIQQAGGRTMVANKVDQGVRSWMLKD